MAYQVTTERKHKPRSGMSMGGLGCGWFELRQDGIFENWNIFNNRPSACGPHFTWDAAGVLFFIVRCQVQGGEPRLFLLQIENSHSAAAIQWHEYHYLLPWVCGADKIDFSASFPFANLKFDNRDVPLDVELEAWSPFIPQNEDDSSLPAAFFDLKVRSRSELPVDVTILATMRNCVGYTTDKKEWKSNVTDHNGSRIVELTADGLDPMHFATGQMGITSVHPDSKYYLGWEHPHPYYERLVRENGLPDIDDTPSRVNTNKETGEKISMDRCFSSIGRSVTLAKHGDKVEHSFIATWNFPNRYARVIGDKSNGPAGYLEDVALDLKELAPPRIEGHWYANRFCSSTDLAKYCVDNAARLKAATRKFHDTFFSSSLPSFVLDQVNSNLNTFRTSTWFTKEGNFGILEGLSPLKSYAGLSTIDVAMYGGISTTALFPNLQRAVIRSHKAIQNDNGSVCHSINLNYRDKDPREQSGKRVDMPAQYVFQALQTAFWYNDGKFLKEVWDSVKKALDYILRERDHNGDSLPDMEGIMCSYDNFPMYGVAPYVASQWLAAVSTAVTAAKLVGDSEAAEQYAAHFAKGAKVLEEKAWNGSYYRLYNDEGGARGDKDEGCMTDQIFGHLATRLVGEKPFLEQSRVHSALKEILKRNYYSTQGLRNCSWPDDKYLHDIADDCWVDQANTCWTGVELAFAAMLMYEGMVDEAFTVTRNVDERYRRWGNYWDHQEFGGHYFRPMSAWGILHGALGFSMCNGELAFAPKVPGEQRYFFITADAYGMYETGNGYNVLRVVNGTLKANKIRFTLPSKNGTTWEAFVPGETPASSFADGELCLEFPDGLELPEGSLIRISQK